MKKLTPFLISCLLVFGTAACQEASKTTVEAPNTTSESVKPPDAKATEAAQTDAQSQVRRDQANSDIRAREQRNNQFNEGKATNRDKSDIASEIRSKMEVNIPKSNLTVEATEQGAVTVSGTVPDQASLKKIEPLAKEIKGVTSVTNKATVVQ